MIKQICIYCKTHFKTIHEANDPIEHLSHGICPECFPKSVQGCGTPLIDFLNSFSCPVLSISTEARVIEANEAAKLLVKKSTDQIRNQPGGDVFECKHAKCEDGCGSTVHCKSCTIRMTVMKTFKTGESFFRVPAYMDLGDIIDYKTVKFFITTQKMHGYVLLQIENEPPFSMNAQEKAHG